jgi:hypothetical protein
VKPLAIAAIGAGALLLMARAKANTAPATTVAKKTADYFTPTDIAASLGGLIVGLTKGIATTPPTGPAYVSPNMPALTGDVAGDASAWLQNIDAKTPTLLGGGWSAPSTSATSATDLGRYSSTVDTVAAAPVYSQADDFTLNPFQFAAP